MTEKDADELKHDVKSGGKILTLLGVVAIVMGILAMLAPGIAGLSIVVLLGVVVTCAGVVRMFWALQASSFSKGILTFALGSLTLICGIGRLDLPGFVAQMSTGWAYRLAAGAPWAMSLFYSSTGRLARRSPTAAKAILSPGFPKVDRAVINRPGVAARLMPAYADATRNSRGPVDDMRLVLRPWDFDPSGIRQPVHLFHGRMDVVTPPAHAEHWMGILDHIHPTWVEDAGHFLIEDQIGAIVRTLSA